MLCVTHWLFPQNLYILDSVATDYNVHAVCDSDLQWTKAVLLYCGIDI